MLFNTLLFARVPRERLKTSGSPSDNLTSPSGGWRTLIHEKIYSEYVKNIVHVCLG